MMTCIYFNYLMKPLAKANRCSGRYNNAPAEGSTESKMLPTKQKKGLFQRLLVMSYSEQFLLIGWERSTTTFSLSRKDDLWLLAGHEAVIAAVTIILP